MSLITTRLMRLPCRAFAALICVSSIATSQAAPVTVLNPSFEAPTAPAEVNPTTEAAFQWGFSRAFSNSIQLASVSGLATRQVNAGVAGGSTQVARLYNNASARSSITQTTGTSLLGNYTYTFSLNIASSSTAQTGGTNLYSGFDITLEAGTEFKYNVYTVASSGFAVTEVSDGDNLSSASYSLSNGSNLGFNQFTTLTMTVTTTSSITASDPLKITIRSGDKLGSNLNTIYDQVALDATAVPEPSVIWAASFAGIALGLYRFRKRCRTGKL